jgi:peptidoglycan/xylan/chitin deacetylase (PgdA/CDA1 family)
MLIRSALAAASPAGDRARVSILIFHRVLPERDPLFPDEPDVERFDEVMGWIKEWFNVLPLGEAVTRLASQTLPARAAAITFDDGYADNLTCATPILRKHGLHATFFIATGYLDGGRMWNDTIIESVRGAAVSEIDCSSMGLGRIVIENVDQKRAALGRLIPALKHLSFDQRSESVALVADACRGTPRTDLMLTTGQLRMLRDSGMGIGAHTVNHPILARMDDSSVRREIADGRDFLEGALGERIDLFAYPNGKLGSDYTPEHAAIVKALGIRAAVSTNWGVCGASSDLFQLPRFTPWDTTKWRFALRMLVNARRPDAALAASMKV